MYIHQHLLDKIDTLLKPSKVLVIYGPRRIGKTTLLNKYLDNAKNYLLTNGEDIYVQDFLSSQSIEKLKNFVGKHTLLVIDEAQKIPQIGSNLKLIVDHCPGVRVIATGSSAFDLAHHLGEPLTGRKITLKMFPLSQIELNSIETPAQTAARLEERLIYGSYPEIILMRDLIERKKYLQELVSSYLYKDILELDGIRKSEKIIQLLQLLAFQLGKEVSLSELGQQLGLNKATIQRYLDLLEKSFVLIKLSGFSRNLRKEISKSSRYYFYDTGIRNAIINQFSPLTLRNDVGELWENYIIIERLKKQSYHDILSNNYFWRTYDQQEIDWIEERDGTLYGYEIKWKKQNIKFPTVFSQSYPNSQFALIHNNNYLEFIT